jgi:hypothetical protein
MKKVYDDETVMGWAVEKIDGNLVGPFDSADEAEAWMREIGVDGEADLDGVIRPIRSPYFDILDEEEDQDDDCDCDKCDGENVCGCDACDVIEDEDEDK